MQREFSVVRSGPERLISAKRQLAETHKNLTAPTPEDPRLAKAQETLLFMLGEYRTKQPGLNRQTSRDMEHMIRDFRDTCKRKGIDMPKLKLVYFVRMNHICVWPQELDELELQKRIWMFCKHRERHNLPVYAEDIAIGVRRGYPDYSPSRTKIILPTNDKLPTMETAQ